MADRKRTLKWLLTIVALLGMTALLVVFFLMRLHPKRPLPLPETATHALMTLARMHQTATKDGKVQWELNAESAQLEAGSHRMILKSPRVVFFMKDGGKVRLTAARGVLDTRSNDMEVSGNVRLQSDRYNLETEALTYRHTARVLQSDVPVHITGSGFDLRADKMIYNLGSETAKFEGQVKGSLNENMAL